MRWYQHITRERQWHRRCQLLARGIGVTSYKGIYRRAAGLGRLFQLSNIHVYDWSVNFPLIKRIYVFSFRTLRIIMNGQHFHA